MGNATFKQTNFTAGQVSPLIYGRTDLSKFYNGVATLENFIATKHGPVCRRAGTKYVAETKSSQADAVTNSRLIPFQYSTDQTYVLEFGDSYIRIYLNRGRLQDDGTVVAIGADADSPFELGSPYFAQTTPPALDTNGQTWAERNSSALNVVGTTGSEWFNVQGVVRLTTTASHGLAAGDHVLVTNDVSGVEDQQEGVFPVLEVVDTTNFRYAKALSTGGTESNDGDMDVIREDLVTLTFASAHGIPVGAWINVTGSDPTEYNGLFQVRTVPSDTTLTHSLSGSSITSPATTEGTVTLVDMSVDKIDYTQSADVMFLAHPNVRPKELQRLNGFKVIAAAYDEEGHGRCRLQIGTTQAPHGFKAHQPSLGIYSKVIVTGMTPTAYNGCFEIESVTDTSITYTPGSSASGTVTSFGNVDGWQLVNYENRDGPYLDLNESTTTALIGDATSESPPKVTFSSASLVFNDYDRLFRIFDNDGGDTDWQWAEIQWITSSTIGRYRNIPRNPREARYPDNNLNVANWRLGAWSHTLGWPRTVNFIQSRVMWGGNAGDPAGFWLTVSNNILDFEPSTFDGGISSIADDNGITSRIDDDRVNSIYWMALTPQGMLMGTDGGEYLLQNRAKFDPLTPSNVVASAQSFIGSKENVKAVRAGNTSVLFVQKAGRKIYHMLYNFEKDSLSPKDITQLSENITDSGIEGLAYQQEPDPIVWAYLTDGTLVGCTYEIEEDVIAWHKHVIGGTDAKVKSIATISDTSGANPTDQLWMIVSRTINGATVEYVEYMEDAYKTGDDIEDAKYVDSMRTYDSTATTTIDSLDHLEGETVKVYGDGVEQADAVVGATTPGEITITSASVVQVGLSYTSKLATLPLEIRQAQPDSSNKIKRMERAQVLFLDSQDVQFGTTETDIEDVQFDDTTTLHSSLVEDMLIQSSYERQQQLWIINSGVFPTTVRAITIEAEVQPIQN